MLRCILPSRMAWSAALLAAAMMILMTSLAAAGKEKPLDTMVNQGKLSSDFINRKTGLPDKDTSKFLIRMMRRLQSEREKKGIKIERSTAEAIPGLGPSRGSIHWSPEVEEVIFAAADSVQKPDHGCEAAKWLTEPVHGAGFGATLHAHVNALLVAIATNRTLVAPPPGFHEGVLEHTTVCGFGNAKKGIEANGVTDDKLRWKDKPTLATINFVAKDGVAFVNESASVAVVQRYDNKGSWGRFPVIPPWLWQSVLDVERKAANTSEGPHIALVSAPDSDAENSSWVFAETQRIPADQLPLIPLGHKMFLVYTILVKYIFRPRAEIKAFAESLLRDNFLEPRNATLFEPILKSTSQEALAAMSLQEMAQLLPQPIGAVHMRFSDKSREDPYWEVFGTYRTEQSYLNAVIEAEKRKGKMGVFFVLSDSLEQMAQLRKRINGELRRATLSDEDDEFQGKSHIRYKGASAAGHLTHFVAQMYLIGQLAESVFVTQSSNVGRLMTELVGARRRLTQTSSHGFLGVSLDCPWSTTAWQYLRCKNNLQKFYAAENRSEVILPWDRATDFFRDIWQMM